MQDLTTQEEFRVLIKRKGSYNKAAYIIGISRQQLSMYLTTGRLLGRAKIEALAKYCDRRIVFPKPYLELLDKNTEP